MLAKMYEWEIRLLWNLALVLAGKFEFEKNMWLSRIWADVSSVSGE